MKRIAMSHQAKTALAAVALLALGGCGVDGSGKAGTDTRSVGAFEEVAIHGALDTEIAVGGPPSVTITGDDNLLTLIETSVVGDRLVIRPTKDMDRELPMKVAVSTEALTGLEVHGASDARVTGLSGEKLDVQLHGASDATLDGKLAELDVQVHGASSLDAQKLAAKKVDLQAHGASSVELGAPDEITASLHGASSAKYDGSPKLDEKLSGSSSIRKR